MTHTRKTPLSSGDEGRMTSLWVIKEIRRPKSEKKKTPVRRGGIWRSREDDDGNRNRRGKRVTRKKERRTKEETEQRRKGKERKGKKVEGSIYQKVEGGNLQIRKKPRSNRILLFIIAHLLLTLYLRVASGAKHTFSFENFSFSCLFLFSITDPCL